MSGRPTLPMCLGAIFRLGRERCRVWTIVRGYLYLRFPTSHGCTSVLLGTPIVPPRDSSGPGGGGPGVEVLVVFTRIAHPSYPPTPCRPSVCRGGPD